MTLPLLGKLDSLLWPLIERLPHDWSSFPLLLSSLMLNVSLCSLGSSLLFHFLNVISSQNTSNNHTDFTKSNVCSCAFFFFFPSPVFLSLSLRQSEWEKKNVCVLPLLINDCAEMTWETECYVKNPRYSPLHGAFLWLIRDSCKAMWQLLTDQLHAVWVMAKCLFEALAFPKKRGAF